MDSFLVLIQYLESLLSFWLKIDESLKIRCSQKLSISYCWYTSGHLKTCFGIFITLHFFDLQGYMSYFRILIKNRLGKFQFIALYSLISTILWHQMLVWILPNMSGVVPSLFDILQILQMVTEGQKVMKKHWRPDFTLDFRLSEVYILESINVKTNIDHNSI